MQRSEAASSHRRGVLALAACAALLIAFATIAWFAVSTKSPTYDEPYHALAGWTQLHRFDYRLDAEDPPLWKFLIGLPNGADALHADFDSPDWTQQPQKQWLQWQWTINTLYETPGNNAERLVTHSRAVMLAVGVLLGVVICWWGWQLGGPAAAVVAGALFCLDPNFLGHAPLVKNDVILSLAMAGLCIALWRAGKRLTWLRLLAIVLLTGVMLTVKFSGVFALAMVPVLLGVRALAAAPWMVLGRLVPGRRGRCGVAVAVTIVAWAGAYLALWAAYGFRYSPTPDPSLSFNTAQLRQMELMKELEVRNDDQLPTDAEIAAATPGLFLQTMMLTEKHHLLPQSCIDGLLFVHQAALIRPQFLLGKFSPTGWWYYFPVAMGLKTPLATLAAFALAAGLGVWMWIRKEIEPADSEAIVDPKSPSPQPSPVRLSSTLRLDSTVLIEVRPEGSSPKSGVPAERAATWWAIACLMIPAAMFLAWAMQSRLNIGVRHVLPVYPMFFVATGWIAAAAIRRWSWWAMAVAGALTLWLAATTLSAYPDYIAFFNRAAGGERGGLHLLSDSNLDWGQNLKLLAAWQRAHPDRPVYLAYFGLADPRAYGIYATRLPGTQTYGTPPGKPKVGQRCVLAVSATFLQGLYLTDARSAQYYTTLAKYRPIDVLGGTIYLYALSGHSGTTVRH